ncbi:MAG: hypothetical protein IT307_19780, partial [Chloroflexi bacterium]|nr:hypothetical protein [Chloroflexota bacterium]
MLRAGSRAALVARLAPPEGALTLVLVVLLCWTTLHSIASAGWGEAVELAPWLALVGALVGYVSARGRLRMLPALAIGALIGVELLWILLALRAPGENWQTQLASLATDLVTWTSRLSSSGATHQPTVFAIAIGWVGWTIGFFSSWLVFRLQHAWWAVVANCAVGIIHLSYAPTNQLPALLAAVVLGILLVASLDVHLRRSVWQSYGFPIGFPETLATLALGAGIAGVALLVAWHLPPVSASEDVSSSWRESWGPFNQAQQQVDRLFGGSRQQSRPVSGLRFSAELAPRSSFDLGTASVFSAA